MKVYLQPAATFALALAIASLPFTLPQGAKALADYSIYITNASEICN